MRIKREAWILGVLLIGFVIATVVLTGESVQQDARKKPSTFNTSPGGLRALYELFNKQQLPARRFELPLTQLPKDAGLLVIGEPIVRPLQDAEGGALQEWLNQGGTLLFIGRSEIGDVDESNLSFEEAKPIPGEERDSVGAISSESGFNQDVIDLKIAGSTAVKILKPERVQKLVTAGSDVYAVTWREKKGRVILVSSAVAVTNEQLKTSPLDNPVFFTNIGQKYVSPSRPVILFDEYHQGYGARRSVDKSLWAAVGPGLRAIAWYGLFAFLLLIYTLNRRFGAVKTLPSIESRPSTEYIASMAALYDRSGAGLLALETIERDFVRDVVARLGLATDAGPEMLAQSAQNTLGWDGNDLLALLRRTRELVSTDTPVTRQMEPELTALAQRLHHYRMELNSRRA